MIRIQIKHSSKGYEELICQGHADYSAAGSDVVCAAVSILTVNTVNAIEEFTKNPMENKAENAKGGLVHIFFPEGTEEKGSLLMDAYILGIKGIIGAYGKKYVTLTEKEIS